MGTYYSITYSGSDSGEGMKLMVDSLLVEINDQVSTYISSATISQFNNAEGAFTVSSDLEHFIANYNKSEELYEMTTGYFDPTVMPLVNYWGFGYTPKRAVTDIDSTRIDSMMHLVGFDKLVSELVSDGLKIRKLPMAKLDFSAIAKGYAVDQIGHLLANHGSQNYMVEIGGEVVTQGLSPRDQPWLIGINTPRADAPLDDLIEYLSLSGVGLASSGNYRIYHEVDGQKYGHTINPLTGYPEINELLAVSVVAKDCMTADAIATACMVMGFDKAQTFINNIGDINACFFIGAPDGTIKTVYSNGFIQYIAQ